MKPFYPACSGESISPRFGAALAHVALVLAALASCTGGRPNVTGGIQGEAGSDNATRGASGGSSTSSVWSSGGLMVVLTGSGGSTTSTSSAGSGNGPNPTVVCGNGKQEQGEACDDGNVDSGDGCAAECKTVEEGYVCPEPAKRCVSSQQCGDKKISGTENCDDGNAVEGDGCAETCRVETGWSCPFVGVRCNADACGDGIVAGAETCDDGDIVPVAGDGCSATCTVESPGPADRDAWVCPLPGQHCRRTTCGNAEVEGTEQCDDGNNDTGDGCTPACRKEPSCPAAGGACRSVCGDGMILSTDTDQQCDDGNSANGDGCSKDCALESGYECLDAAVKPTGSLILPIIYRDFKGGTTIAQGQHPDFEHANGKAETGIVLGKLGLDGKPVHAASNLTTTTNNDTATTPNWFAIWYRDAVADLPTTGSPRYNYTYVDNLTLAETATGSGTFRYTNTAFYPIDGRTPSFGNTQGQSHNYHFTSEVRYWFQYSGNELLTFTGDDDVWVFVNKQLAVDLGGIHSAINGSVLLHATDGTGSVCENAAPGCANPRIVPLGLERGKVYEIVVFQAERHTVQSNYTLTVSAFNSIRSSCHSVCGDAIVTPDEACDLGAEKNTGAYGTCTRDCRLPPYCGDAKLDVADAEECDDGVNLSAYGYNGSPACAPQCKLTHFCGDSKLDSLFGEQCDDGNRTSGDGCEGNCTHRIGCGNGFTEVGEDCDDGNTVSKDGCSEFCTIESILF